MTPSRTGEHPVRVAIIGTGRRSGYLYGPLLHALEDTELVAVWGRSAASAEALGAQLGVPAYTDLDRLLRETAPQVGVVSVDSAANGQVGRLAVEHGLHVLLETPIARQLSEADAIIEAARHQGLKIEVAEIPPPAAGAGQAGPDRVRADGPRAHFVQRLLRPRLPRRERAHAQLPGLRLPAAAGHRRRAPLSAADRPAARRRSTAEFEARPLEQRGLGSPLRWWRSSRFLAERGMGISVGVGLSRIAPGRRPAVPDRAGHWERVDGGAHRLDSSSR